MDRGRLEGFREQATSSRLSTHRDGQEAASLRAIALGATLGCYCRSPQSRQAGGRMRFPWQHESEREDLEQELQSHLQKAAGDRIERGESAESARQAARREFG